MKKIYYNENYLQYIRDLKYVIHKNIKDMYKAKSFKSEIKEYQENGTQSHI